MYLSRFSMKRPTSLLKQVQPTFLRWTLYFHEMFASIMCNFNIVTSFEL